MNKQKIINNQFGELKVDLNKEIEFKNGLIGISKATKFVLIKCPLEKFKDFMVLQSLEFDDLSFMLLPIDINDNKFYKNGDIEDACNDVNINLKDVLIMLVVSLKEVDEIKKLIVNLRAPILIDSHNKVGMQYALTNGSYSIQTLL